MNAVTQAALTRAAAHSFPNPHLSPEARFQGAVDDLSAARALLAIEGGAGYRRVANGRWHIETGTPVPAGKFSIIVNELIRTGLLIHHLSGHLVPAPVHLAVQIGTRWESACAAAGEGMGPKRVRLVDDPDLADCPACVRTL